MAGHDPASILIGGGATPHMAPLEDHTWETLSLNWENDVAVVFTWLHAILNHPTDSLKHVVVISSGAGLFGSPGSGGYAGAKATTRFLTSSATDSAKCLGRGVKFTTANPKLTIDTDIGAAITTVRSICFPPRKFMATTSRALLLDFSQPTTYR